MRKHLISLLFRLLDKDTIKELSKTNKTELSMKLAELYENGIFMSWLNDREVSIYNVWKTGTSEKDNIARGRIFELEGIKSAMKKRYITEKEHSEQVEKSKEQ